MIDIANSYLDEHDPSSSYVLKNMHKRTPTDAGQNYYTMDNLVKTTPNSLKNFVFPRPPQVQPSIPRPQSTSSNNGTSDSDTQSDTDCRCRPKSRPKRSSPISIRTTSITSEENLSCNSPKTLQSLPTLLPPIGVFWDIENCNVPKGCSAVLVAQVIRASFFEGYREAEFVVVCDVTKEPSKVIEELNDAQVNLIHVPSLHKNAADEKLRQSMRRFADIHGSPAAVVLITGDINFLSDVCDLRHRRKLHVILLHRDNTSEALILCANENYNIVRLFESLPQREPKAIPEQFQVTVYNLPDQTNHPGIKNRLKRISDNCGGRVGNLLGNGMATLVFTSIEYASRAQKRMEGADVYGNKITIGDPTPLEKRNGATPTKQQRQPSGRNYLSTSAPQQAVATYNSPSPVALLPLPAPLYDTFGWTSDAVPKQDSAFGLPLQIPSGLPCCLMEALRSAQRYGLATQFLRTWTYLVQSSIAARKAWEGTPASQWNSGAWPGSATYVESHSQRKTVKSSSEKTPETGRSILKKNQDPDYMLMPPPSMLVPPLSMASMQVQPPSRQAPVRNRSPKSASASSKHGSNENQSPKNAHLSQTNQNYFHPISTIRPQEVVELQVTNLDRYSDAREIKKLLSALFGEYVHVIHVSVYSQSDGDYAARIKVPSLQAAQYAISQLHRRKVGFRRIVIKYANTDGPSPQLVRSQIVSLLSEVPSHRLQLFSFCELFESRYLSTVSVSDLYKMKDVCLITDDKSGRVISLNPDHRNTPSPAFNTSQDMELPYCTLHVHRPGQDKGWAEQEVDALPSVRIGLTELTYRIHTLIQSHKGTIPLPSLPHCYEAQFQPLEVDETGVPLEHLVSCLPDVEIYQGVGCAKYLRWLASSGNSDEPTKCVSPLLAKPQTQFSRELVDLLKMSPRCQLLFNRFIPAYHHHFGRQCRVADYGYTKLIDLLEALAHTVQVMGEGANRVITLSHRSQVRRFTSDLLRVLKRAANKQMSLSELPAAFSAALGKEFDIVEYGVCHLLDMLSAVNQAIVRVEQKDNDVIVSLPKRTQTLEEVARTEKFAYEVVELLRHVPHCTMTFSNFIPSYHHNFGYQCRVSNYGFVKLIELFEAIPHVAKIEDSRDGERTVSLTPPLSLSVLANQMASLIRSTADQSLLLADLPAVFKYQYGYAMKPETYGCSNILQVMQLLQDTVSVSDSGSSGPLARLATSVRQHSQALKVWWVMAEHKKGLSGADFLQAYWKRYKETVDLNLLITGLGHIVEVETVAMRDAYKGEIVYHLTDDWWFAYALYTLLLTRGGRMPLAELFAAYGTPDRDLSAVLPRIADVVVTSGGYVALNEKKLAEAGIALPEKHVATPKEKTPVKVLPFSCPHSNSPWVIRSSPEQYKLFGTPVHGRSMGLSLLLPSMQIQESVVTSPASSSQYPAPAVPQRIMAPDASQLPMPISLAVNKEPGGMLACDSWLNNGEEMYSILTNDMADNSSDKLDSMGSVDGMQGRITRKKRMAAHFSSPIQA